MTGIFGNLTETGAEGKAGLSHKERFGQMTDSCCEWRSGRTLLLVDAAERSLDNLLEAPALPKRMNDAQLWFPVSASSSRPTGPVYSVGVRRAGALIRVRSSSAIRYLPGVLAIVAGVRGFVVCDLDNIQPSMLRHIIRLLKRHRTLSGSAVTDVLHALDGSGDALRRRTEPAVDFSASGTAQALRGLPPAAGTILKTISRAAIGESHRTPFERRGAAQLLSALEDRGLIIILPTGQLVDSARYERLAREVRGAKKRYSAKEAASRWRTTVGTARALLARIGREESGSLTRPDGSLQGGA